MSGIRGKNTKPEVRVRSHLHRHGLRFRLHVGDLPGRPDIVLPRYRAAVEVRGCFWHQHPGCRFAARPKSNAAFWEEKFRQNRVRDSRKKNELVGMGWRVFIVWECQTGDARLMDRLVDKIRKSQR